MAEPKSNVRSCGLSEISPFSPTFLMILVVYLLPTLPSVRLFLLQVGAASIESVVVTVAPSATLVSDA